jgi:hypothetical protein
MAPVVNFGVTINFDPSPNNVFASVGAHLEGVRSWKAMLEGMVGAENSEARRDFRTLTAFLNADIDKFGTKPYFC